jgi:alpha-N-arabinofuranosidase
VIAGFLNGFVRNADVVKMANMAQLVNVIGPIFTNEKGSFKQTIYYPLQLFAQHMYGTSLDVFVDCDTYDTEQFFIGLGEQTTQQKDVPYLDVSASVNNNELIIAVVNRHKDRAISTDILLQEGSYEGKFSVFEVNGNDVKDANDFDSQNVLTKEKNGINAKGQKLTYNFPAHSFTLIKGKIK